MSGRNGPVAPFLTQTIERTPQLANTTETSTQTAPEKPKNVRVAASLSPELYAQFAEIRFSQKHNKESDVVVAAIAEYVAAHQA